MGVEEGKFGVRFRPGYRTDEGLPLRFPLAVLAIAAVVSFVSFRGCRKSDSLADVISQDKHNPGQNGQNQKPSHSVDSISNSVDSVKSPAEAPTPPPDPAAERRAAMWLKGADLRSVADKTLLDRLAAAERRGDDELILTTLEKLRMRPGLCDLEDAISLRIGDIRAKRLFTAPAEGASEPEGALVAIRETRRTDNLLRLAREYGTTPGAIARMNSLAPNAALAQGAKLRILKFPRTLLQIRRRTGVCDLYLNDRFFRRYYAAPGAAGKPGPYSVTQTDTPRHLFAVLGVKLAAADAAELADLLPAGSKVVVAN